MSEEPSVTQILHEAGLVGYEGVPMLLLEEAAERGKFIHHLTELIDADMMIDEIPAGVEGYIEGYLNFLEDNDVEWTHSEHRVESKVYRYIGHLDRAGKLNEHDYCIVDIKCVASVLDSTALQTMGYAMAMHEETGQTEYMLNRFALQLNPKLSRGYAIHTFKNYQDRHDWTAAVRVAHWKLNHGTSLGPSIITP